MRCLLALLLLGGCFFDAGVEKSQARESPLNTPSGAEDLFEDTPRGGVVSVDPRDEAEAEPEPEPEPRQSFASCGSVAHGQIHRESRSCYAVASVPQGQSCPSPAVQSREHVCQDGTFTLVRDWPGDCRYSSCVEQDPPSAVLDGRVYHSRTGFQYRAFAKSEFLKFVKDQSAFRFQVNKIFLKIAGCPNAPQEALAAAELVGCSDCSAEQIWNYCGFNEAQHGRLLKVEIKSGEAQLSAADTNV